MGAAIVVDGLTIKQLRFCHAFIKNGGNASAAYRGAYDAEKMGSSSIGREASLLLDHPSVTAKIEALEAQVAVLANVTPEGIAAEFDDNRSHALQWRQASAMNSATERKADLLDLFGKRQMSVRRLSVDVTVDANVDDLRALETRLLKELGPGVAQGDELEPPS
jgi:phage terminase small subunit